MSLLVNAYQRDAATNAILLVEANDHSLELGGFERCRQELWGSETAKRLGLILLPTLAEQDLYAEGDDLLRLESEAQTILRFVDVFVTETDYDKEYIAHRTRNIIAAVARAKDVRNGGVVIW